MSDPIIITFSIQTVTDDTLTDDSHVLSAYVKFTPYELTDDSWGDARQELLQRVNTEIQKLMPDFLEYVEDQVVLCPKDLEQRLGLRGGHPDHLEMSMGQMFDNRPLPGWGYSTPVEGLYLCGSDTHPGGTVTGLPGSNCAQEIISGSS